MSYAQGIDFRQTSTYVTDPANCAYELGASADYPTTTPQGNVVGWEQSLGSNSRNRSTSVDPRLAGINFATVTNGVKNFRFDLPAAGAYEITLAIGDDANSQTGNYASIYDSTTLLATVVSGATSASGSFYDATGTEYTAANWPTKNTPVTLTFASTICRIAIGATSGSGSNTAIAHVFVQAAGTSVSIAGASATGAVAAFTPSLSSAPLGVAAAAGAAALIASVAAGLSGAAATGEAASPVGGALPGVAAVAAAAGLIPSLADGAGAVSATAAAEAVTAGSGTHAALTGAAATGLAAALGIVSQITLSPAVAFAVAASIPEPMAPAAAFGIAGPVAGYVPALVADPVFIARGPALRFIARGPALRLTAIGRVGMRTNDLSPPIAAKAETRTVTFDFGPQLAAGVMLTAIEAMNASVHWGYADPTPDANWQGAAQIIASPTTGAASQAVAQIYGNVPGATVYLLQCEAAASDGTMPVLETTLTSYVPS